MSETRVAVMLKPRKSSKFINMLKHHKKNPKLRIDNVRRTKDLSMVVDHCRRRWKNLLAKLEDPPLCLFLEDNPVNDYSVTIEELCNEYGLGTTANGKLTLYYDVVAEAGHTPEAPGEAARTSESGSSSKRGTALTKAAAGGDPMKTSEIDVQTAAAKKAEYENANEAAKADEAQLERAKADKAVAEAERAKAAQAEADRLEKDKAAANQSPVQQESSNPAGSASSAPQAPSASSAPPTSAVSLPAAAPLPHAASPAAAFTPIQASTTGAPSAAPVRRRVSVGWKRKMHLRAFQCGAHESGISSAMSRPASQSRVAGAPTAVATAAAADTLSDQGSEAKRARVETASAPTATAAAAVAHASKPAASASRCAQPVRHRQTLTWHQCWCQEHARLGQALHPSP